MPPIIAFKLPVLLLKPLDNQLLTLYLIRSNPNKEPYDPDYLKKARKQSRTLSPKAVVKFKSKSNSIQKNSKPKPPIKAKDETTKSIPEKSKKSKSSAESKKSTKSKSKTQPVTSTPNSKNLKKSLSTAEGDKSTSQVLSIPSTSKAKPTKVSNTTKTATSKKDRSNGQSSSSKASASGTPSTSRRLSDSKTPSKSNQSSHPSPSPSKQRKFKPQPHQPQSQTAPVLNVPEGVRNFKIPKKPKAPPVDEKTIPKRLQPSGFSPVDLIIRSSPGFSSTTAKIKESTQNQSREPQQIEEDFDSFEAAEPELGFDLYGAEEAISQPLEDFSSVNGEPSIGQENEEAEEVGAGEWRQDEPIDEPMEQSFTKSSLPSQTISKAFDDDSESSENEDIPFKRRGSRDKSNSDSELPSKQEKKDPVLPPSDSPTKSRPRPPPPLASSSQPTSKVISLRPPPSSARSSIPSSLSPPRQLPSSPSAPSSSASTIQSVISSVKSVESPEEAMRVFIKSVECYPQILASAISKFQDLFINLLLNLFRDVNFIMSWKRFEVLLKLIRQLSMDDSNHWEEIICSWGRNYKSLLSNKEKLENIVIVVSSIYDHLQSNQILINLPSAGLLYEMKMAKYDENDN